MKILIPLVAASAVLITATAGAFAQTGGGGNTTRPSYDNPRAYDRDSMGNETYQYKSSPDQMRNKKKMRRKMDDDD